MRKDLYGIIHDILKIEEEKAQSDENTTSNYLIKTGLLSEILEMLMKK